MQACNSLYWQTYYICYKHKVSINSLFQNIVRCITNGSGLRTICGLNFFPYLIFVTYWQDNFSAVTNICQILWEFWYFFNFWRLFQDIFYILAFNGIYWWIIILFLSKESVTLTEKVLITMVASFSSLKTHRQISKKLRIKKYSLSDKAYQFSALYDISCRSYLEKQGHTNEFEFL